MPIASSPFLSNFTMASAPGYAHSTVMTAPAVHVQIELPHGLARPQLGGPADLASIDGVDLDLDP